MPETMTCKTKSAALAALAAIAGTMRGTQRDTLRAVAAWITESMNDDVLPGDMAARIQRIFEGTPEEQAGRRWIESELHNPAYTAGTAIEGQPGRFIHKMINEPEPGAEYPCFWDTNTKAWQPDHPWPPFLPQTDFPDNEEGEE